MLTKIQEFIKFIRSHGNIVRFSNILKAGFHPDILIALEKQGKIVKIARGLYQLTNNDLGSHPDLVAASLQAPGGVICLISALAFHEATNEIPYRVDMAICQGTHANRIKYPPVRFYRFAPQTWEAGIEKTEIGGHKIKVYSLAKTIADCFKFRNRIGINVARDALKVAVMEKKSTPKKIMQYAKLCRSDRIIKPILEAIL